MSKCPNCAGICEPEDRFCQDCGQPLAQRPFAKPAAKAGFGWGRKKRGDGDDTEDFGSLFGMELPEIPAHLNNAPAELILGVAAILYVVSAVVWANHESLGALAQKYIGGVRAAVPFFHQQPKRSAPATVSGGTAAKDAKPATPEMRSNTTAVKSGSAAPVIVRSSPPVVPKTAEPVATPPPKLAAPVKQPDTTPPVKAFGGDVPAIKIKPVKPEEVKTVAEYNKLLADYFTRHEQGMSTDGEPPSYSEWIAGNRQPF